MIWLLCACLIQTVRWFERVQHIVVHRGPFKLLIESTFSVFAARMVRNTCYYPAKCFSVISVENINQFHSHFEMYFENLNLSADVSRSVWLSLGWTSLCLTHSCRTRHCRHLFIFTLVYVKLYILIRGGPMCTPVVTIPP